MTTTQSIKTATQYTVTLNGRSVTGAVQGTTGMLHGTDGLWLLRQAREIAEHMKQGFVTMYANGEEIQVSLVNAKIRMAG